MLKPNTPVTLKLDGKSYVASIVGVVSDFSPMFVIYIVHCPGIIKYDCFPAHSSMIEPLFQ